MDAGFGLNTKRPRVAGFRVLCQDFGEKLLDLGVHADRSRHLLDLDCTAHPQQTLRPVWIATVLAR